MLKYLLLAVWAAAYAAAATANTSHVMMQGFYWDCPEDWYLVMEERAGELRDMQGGYGIDRIWFPAPQKSHAGRRSMGYDPYDYYDLGQLDQKGTVPTHFGTQNQLRNTIATLLLSPAVTARPVRVLAGSGTDWALPICVQLEPSSE